MIVNGESCLGVDVNNTSTIDDHFAMKMSPVLEVLRRCNNFFIQGLTSLQGECRPLVVAGKQVGLVRPDVACCLLQYPHVFTATPSAFIMNPQLDNYTNRSEAVAAVLADLRRQEVLTALKGWRDECFNVFATFGEEPLFQVERSAASALGIRAFGVHVTGYSRLPGGGVAVWLQRRAATKPTYPGQMDTMVGGGLTAGLTPPEVLVKEAAEEASVPEELVQQAKAAGCVSFMTETERGVHANTEFVYDLELPHDFVPHNSDGEVDGFEAVPLQDLLPRVLSCKYKLTSVPVAIDFLIRHGVIGAHSESNLPAVQELLHLPLNQLYTTWPSVHLLPSPPRTPTLDSPTLSLDAPRLGRKRELMANEKDKVHGTPVLAE